MACLVVKALWLTICVVDVAGKHIAVLGGMMKSHHISVVPLIEGLLDRGHSVSFVVPNTTEHRTYFPKGVGDASMVYLGSDDWGFDTMFTGPDYDIKNLPWYKKPLVFVKVLSEYRETLDKPIFSMYNDLAAWLEKPGLDAVLCHATSFGSRPLVIASGIPWVSYLSVPPLPLFTVFDADKVCRYPNFVKPPSVAELKESLVARVKNHMICRFLQGYVFFADREIGALFEARGLSLGKGLLETLMDAPAVMLLGGPPLSLNVELGPRTHVLGIVDKAKPHPIPVDMLNWLDAARDASAPVVYVSMGTKYELQEATCTKLVAMLDQMAKTIGVRVLWSLRASQQQSLRHLLPAQSASILIGTFMPQPEVLQHAAVRVFLSHCGWGGVTDTIVAGVPVLGYPGMQDQFSNAQMLQEAGAGITLDHDFSNLPAGTKLLLEDPKFAAASKAAGETLRSYGGLPRAIEIIEAAADGAYLQPDATVRARMSEVDPFFNEPQMDVQWIALAVCVGLLSVCLFAFCCCFRCFCLCCCGRGAKTAAADPGKKQQ